MAPLKSMGTVSYSHSIVLLKLTTDKHEASQPLCDSRATCITCCFVKLEIKAFLASPRPRLQPVRLRLRHWTLRPI